MNRTIFDKIGLPRPLAWAYLGILIFMMGDGIEQGWLSPYLIGRGLSLEQSAGLFTMYGVTIAISAWFSGVLAEAYGVKRTMFAGLVLYLLGTCGFVGQIGVYTGWVSDVAAGTKAAITPMDWIGLVLICFILPAVLSTLFCRLLEKRGWIREGDLKLDL